MDYGSRGDEQYGLKLLSPCTRPIKAYCYLLSQMCLHTLVGVENVDILGELGTLVSSSLPQSSKQTQPSRCVPYHTPI